MLKKKIDLKELRKSVERKMTKISTSLKSNGKNKNFITCYFRLYKILC